MNAYLAGVFPVGELQSRRTEDVLSPIIDNLWGEHIWCHHILQVGDKVHIETRRKRLLGGRDNLNASLVNVAYRYKGRMSSPTSRMIHMMVRPVTQKKGAATYRHNAR